MKHMIGNSAASKAQGTAASAGLKQMSHVVSLGVLKKDSIEKLKEIRGQSFKARGFSRGDELRVCVHGTQNFR